MPQPHANMHARILCPQVGLVQGHEHSHRPLLAARLRACNAHSVARAAMHHAVVPCQLDQVCTGQDAVHTLLPYCTLQEAASGFGEGVLPAGAVHSLLVPSLQQSPVFFARLFCDNLQLGAIISTYAWSCEVHHLVPFYQVPLLTLPPR